MYRTIEASNTDAFDLLMNRMYRNGWRVVSHSVSKGIQFTLYTAVMEIATDE